MAIDFFHPTDNEDEVLDVRSQDEQGVDGEWVSVATAAEKAGADTGTVRHWYRSGLVPVKRSAGDHGSFLVRLGTVLDLAGQANLTAAAAELEALWDGVEVLDDEAEGLGFAFGADETPLSRLDDMDAPDLTLPTSALEEIIELDEPILLAGPAPANQPEARPFKLGQHPDDVLPTRSKRGRR